MEVAWLLHKAFGFSNTTESTPYDHAQTLLRGRQVMQTGHTHGFSSRMDEEL
jgi:hypothetical protein